MTKTQVAALMWVILRALPMPSGHIYAQLMEKVSLEKYSKLIQVMKDSGLITESNHMLSRTDRGTAVYNRLNDILSAVHAE